MRNLVLVMILVADVGEVMHVVRRILAHLDVHVRSRACDGHARRRLPGHVSRAWRRQLRLQLGANLGARRLEGIIDILVSRELCPVDQTARARW